MSTYQAPIPPISPLSPSNVTAPPASPGPRVGGFDAHGNPQDTLTERSSGSIRAQSGRSRLAHLWSARPARAPRSVLVAVVLAALLGPVGLLYSSKAGALLTSALFLVLALPLVAVWWKWIFVAAALTAPVCVTWALVVTLGRNAIHALRRRVADPRLR